MIWNAALENNRAYLLRTDITKSHLNNHICQHCGMKTNTVSPCFYYFFNISLSCNNSMPSFNGNLWRLLFLGNHLKLMWTFFVLMVPALVHIKELELHPKGKRQSFVVLIATSLTALKVNQCCPVVPYRVLSLHKTRRNFGWKPWVASSLGRLSFFPSFSDDTTIITTGQMIRCYDLDGIRDLSYKVCTWRSPLGTYVQSRMYSPVPIV